MGAFAEFERSLIGERQKEGMALAAQRGACKGRKKALAPERSAELVQRWQRFPKAVLARDYGISRETVYQYLPHAKLDRASPPAGVALIPDPRRRLLVSVHIRVRTICCT